MSNPWFALKSRHQHEKNATVALGLVGFSPFLPLYRSRRRWSDRIQTLDLPLFPGYVFCRIEPGKRGHALATPGIIGIVGFGGRAEPIPDSEIESLEMISASGLPTEPWPHLKTGDYVTIDAGPLRGLRGKLLRDPDEHRLVIGVELLQRSVAVTLNPDQAWPEKSAQTLYARAS